jgi:hypothetical protein
LLLLLLLLLLLQVFPTSGWDELWATLKSSVAEGGPAYHLVEYTVQDNSFLAVHGGWKVRALQAVAAIADDCVDASCMALAVV